MICHIAATSMPWFRFEWHPENRNVYVIRKPRDGDSASRETGELMMDDVQSEHEAHVAVQSFLRGYRERADEGQLFNGKGPRHLRMFAEAGKIGATLRGL